ncbi:phospholipase D-like domain-containing protein [Paraburkholderia sp. HP33-1]|uniref:phospholipase D-like domain-containing protein n=1 Tax=Paraburkholderia sp. HP33-1 TaxID=2883243 RepID=UPI001F2D628E|nr:phospholipase D-like domain-containing protein [Paraburkholderia sp. HP33-1]
MTETIEVRAFRGSDSVFLAWWHPTKINGCLGYSVSRRVNGGAATPLEAYVGFSTGRPVTPNPDGQPSTLWPYQRFTWTDFNPPANGTVEYLVVAIGGSPKAPAATDIASDWVSTVTPKSDTFTPFFNVGIVAARWFAEMAKDYPAEFDKLQKALAPSHDKSDADAGSANEALEEVLRKPMVKNGSATPTIGDELGGALAKQVKSLLDDAFADADMHVYLALFELSDGDVIDRLLKLKKRCHLILANGTHTGGRDENAEAAQALDAQVDIYRRMLKPAGTYAHNKFAVFVKKDRPVKVFTGSTNLTPHGLYTQVNNGLLVNVPDIAQAYYDEWNRLKAAGNETPPPPLPPAKEQYHFNGNGVSTSLFFSPHHLPKSQGADSPDLKYAASLIRGARQGILTLMLDPGWQGSLLQDIREQADADSSLYIRGVVNSDPTIHSRGDDPTAIGFLHGTEAVPSNYDIVVPAAQRASGKPILDALSRVGIVVVHSKVIVIDPLGDHPVVMTGSHNDGPKAAVINDDNLIIIENDRELALAYAINVISTFNHFWWRHNMAPPSARKNAKGNGSPVGGPAHLTSAHEWTGLDPTDAWQNKFFASGSEANEVRFWGISTRGLE